MERQKRGFLYNFAKTILPPFFYPVYRLKVVGKENIPPEGGLLLCCNHVSMKDPVFLGIVQKRMVHYMAKEELFHSKFLGKLFRGLGAFPVLRGSGGGDALQEAYDILEAGKVVGVFIEGHRSPDGALQRPKTGAALLAQKTGLPVVPVCITGKGGGLPKPFSKVMVRFGPPLPIEQLSMADESSQQLRRGSRVIMAEIQKLREASLEALGTPLPPPPPPAPKLPEGGDGLCM